MTTSPLGVLSCPSPTCAHRRCRPCGAGAGRVVQESVSMLYPDRGSSWIDENAPTDLLPMARANIAAEANTNRFSGSAGRRSCCVSADSTGLAPATASRCSPRLATISASSWAAGQLRLLSPDGRRGCGRRRGTAAPAGTFNIVDDEPLTKRDYAAALATADRPCGGSIVYRDCRWPGSPSRATRRQPAAEVPVTVGEPETGRSRWAGHTPHRPAACGPPRTG